MELEPPRTPERPPTPRAADPPELERMRARVRELLSERPCASCGKTPPAVAFERFATSGKRHKTCTACRTARTLLALGAPRCAACDGAHRAHTCRNARGTRKAWWTPQEEANLQKLMGEMGTGRNWPAVAERLGTGRTPSAVEDHWRRHTGRRAQE